MQVKADGLTWRASVPLRYGKHLYKFVVFDKDNQEKWIPDPLAPLDETDKVNDNSVLQVLPVEYKVPASSEDGTTAGSLLLHANGYRDVSFDSGQLTVTLRARPDDVSHISGQSAGRFFPMKLVRKDDRFAFYQASLPWNQKRDLIYKFELKDGKKVNEFGTNGLSSQAQPFKVAAKSFRPFLLTDAAQGLKMEGPLTTRSIAGPSWSHNQPIYEVNLDVYGFRKGTALREFEKHLPVLKEMGVGLVWFMPLHPRGEKKAFGSPYAVRDYQEINPDFGTKEEFKHLVSSAHKLGLRVLMDWVPNHTSWDNAMISAHPEFYLRGEDGQIAQAQTWTDVAQLDYGQNGKWNRALWNQMRDNMMLWVRDFDVDGFRCDVAGSNGRVPIEFWNWVRPQLSAVKPVFMLAEADNVGVHPAFDMSYSWAMPPILWDVCAGRKSATAIDGQLQKEALAFPDGAVLMRFLDNHDWHPHADWGWGQGPAVDTKSGLPQVAPLMVLCATLPGKPLLYNGQEMSFLKTNPPSEAGARTGSPVWPFYRSLLELHKSEAALSNGSFRKIASNYDDKIYAFTRKRDRSRVMVVVNLSDQPQKATLQDATLAGNYMDGFTGKTVSLRSKPTLDLEPWAYRVYVSKGG